VEVEVAVPQEAVLTAGKYISDGEFLSERLDKNLCIIL